MGKTLLLTLVLLVGAMAAASTADSNVQPNNTAAVRTYLLPDLSLKSVLSPELTEILSPGTKPSVLTAAGPKKRGTCRCSCGFPCATDADCGGVSCDPFITCCDKSGSRNNNEWFYQGVINSSHKTALPEEVLKPGCK